MLLPKPIKLCTSHRLIMLLHRSCSTSQAGNTRTSSETIAEVRQRVQWREEEEARRRKQPDPEKELLDEVDSIASVMMLKHNQSKYPSFARKRAELQRQMEANKALARVKQSSKSLSFPLAAEKKSEIFQKPKSETAKNLSDHLYDEYVPATAIDLPETELNELPFTFHGYNNDPVEEVQMVFPGQRMRSMKDNPKMNWKKKSHQGQSKKRKQNRCREFG
uniref:Uncharacterized protein n=1 Tax=Ditylenchus dipsaci TaxID=166011 RepID=A0A915E3F1_9BILA